jgi:hypothetical protein
MIERHLREPFDRGRVRVNEHDAIESAGAKDACRDTRAE